MPRVVAADGVELVTATEGSGSPPLVFIHGSNGGLDSWSDVARRITGHRIVRYARRNYAPSAMGPARNTFQLEADDLLAIVRTVGEPVHLVGGSYGAIVALHAAAKCTDQILSLALFEPPLLQSGSHLTAVLDEYRNLCAADQFGEALTMFLRKAARVPAEIIAGAPAVPDDPEAAQALLGDLEAMSSGSDDVRRWATIGVPTLLMQGGQSWPPLPEGMDRLASVIAHCERVIWPDQSHFATAAAPNAVADAIQRFIGRLD